TDGARERAEEARRKGQARARGAAARRGGGTGGKGARRRDVVVQVPGLLPRDPARETYRVRPGATTIVALEAGDRVTVRDVHGGQRGLLSSPELGLESDLFGPASAPGAEEHFDVDRRARLTVSTPAGTPVVEGGMPASDLLVEVMRATPRGDPDAALPEPLADPRLDFEVPRASALAYEVK